MSGIRPFIGLNCTLEKKMFTLNISYNENHEQQHCSWSRSGKIVSLRKLCPPEKAHIALHELLTNAKVTGSFDFYICEQQAGMPAYSVATFRNIRNRKYAHMEDLGKDMPYCGWWKPYSNKVAVFFRFSMSKETDLKESQKLKMLQAAARALNEEARQMHYSEKGVLHREEVVLQEKLASAKKLKARKEIAFTKAKEKLAYVKKGLSQTSKKVILLSR